MTDPENTTMRTLQHVFLVVLLLAPAACGKDKEDPNRLAASGHVEATDVRISTKIGGRLESLPIQEGDAVAAGQLLGKVETVDIELAIAQGRAERAAAQAELNLRVAGPSREDIAQAQAGVDRAQADLTGAQKDLERMQGLLDRGSGTTKARDDARTRRDVAAATLQGQREALRRLKVGTRREEVDASRARVTAGDAGIAQLEQKLRDATITSPLAGVVTEKLAEPGELLQAGSPLCVVTDLAHAWVTAYVPGPDLARLRMGQPATVVTDDGQTRQGRITFIASEAEFTPKNVQTRDERVKLVYEIKISLDNRDGLFKPGMPAEARLDLAPRQSGERRTGK
ncbi:MAG TPA: HlyD family efflux transporter periplasmic adaptor subunit [Thermoanaerobaculia bacterium]|nr:HlyD family efflux transporter periplasmic adaptor subunit [Thermoanaerobaculia bacterium]